MLLTMRASVGNVCHRRGEKQGRKKATFIFVERKGTEQT
jgi:hypothetical protein